MRSKNCTDRLQPIDVSVLKDHLHNNFTKWYASQAGVSPENKVEWYFATSCFTFRIYNYSISQNYLINGIIVIIETTYTSNITI